MNDHHDQHDDFLHQFREAPRPEFSRALYERIAQQPTEQQRARRRLARHMVYSSSLAGLMLMIMLGFAVVSQRVNHQEPPPTETLAMLPTENHSAFLFDGWNVSGLLLSAAPIHHDSAALLLVADTALKNDTETVLKVERVPLAHHEK